MKRWLLTAAAVLLCTTFTGCELYEPDVDSMLKPPLLSDLQTEVYNALQDVVGEEFRLCYPRGGEYRTPYVFHDLNADGQEEALVFYTLEEDGDAFLQILNKADNVWRAANALPGNGGEVEFVSFCHLIAEDSTDILVGWSNPDRDTNVASVYRVGNGQLQLLYETSYHQIAAHDFDRDGIAELLAATADGGVSVRLIGSRDGELQLLDSAYSTLRLQTLYDPVVGHIRDKQPGAVLAGRINAEMAAALVVEVTDDTIWLPQEAVADAYAGGYCYSGVLPCDINGDTVIELTWSSQVPGYQSTENLRYFTEYRDYTADGKYLTVCTAYENQNDGWRLILPEAMEELYRTGSLSLARQAELREVVFFRYAGSLTEYDEELLRIRVIATDYAEQTIEGGYELLQSRGQFAFYAKLPEGSLMTHEMIQNAFSFSD